MLNGHKMWITSGMNADAYLVFARTGPKEERHKSITAFMVDRNKCVETSPIHVIGLRGGTGTAEVKFVDCELGGDDAVVGEVNKLLRCNKQPEPGEDLRRIDRAWNSREGHEGGHQLYKAEKRVR